MSDHHDLQRFVDAQAETFDTALQELERGAKRSHWMWFVFPQIAGLGHSEMARHYAIADLAEARAYLAHPLLGARYRRCVAVLDGLTSTSSTAVFGGIDAIKLRSSLTLFGEAGAAALCAPLIARWFGGEPDPATLQILGEQS